MAAPGSVEARRELALALATLGRADEARAQLRQAIRVRPARRAEIERLAAQISRPGLRQPP